MSIKLQNPRNFWITNVSNIDVHLSDLGVRVPAGVTLDLLNKNYNFTYDELVLSKDKGSLLRKKDKVRVRKVPPEASSNKNIMEIEYNSMVHSRRRSAVEVKEVYYEELEVSEEEFAAQSVELMDTTYPKK